MLDSFRKLAPWHLVKSPVMAIVFLGTVLSALITLAGASAPAFGWSVTAILFVTVLFANFAEAIAEARGRGQAASLRRARKDLIARRLADAKGYKPGMRGAEAQVPAAELQARRPGRRLGG